MAPAAPLFPEVLERDMSATPADLERGIKAAFPDSHAWENCGEGGIFRIAAGGAAMEMEISPGPPRIIALLCLPTPKVRIRFTAGAAAERQALLERLDRALQRGGG